MREDAADEPGSLVQLGEAEGKAQLPEFVAAHAVEEMLTGNLAHLIVEGKPVFAPALGAEDYELTNRRWRRLHVIPLSLLSEIRGCLHPIPPDPTKTQRLL